VDRQPSADFRIAPKIFGIKTTNEHEWFQTGSWLLNSCAFVSIRGFNAPALAQI
jgi:hypothetical protein